VPPENKASDLESVAISINKHTPFWAAEKTNEKQRIKIGSWYKKK
jgi:hypothetical protein